MGLGGVSIASLLLIFVIVLLLFGTKKLRNIGKDLGAGIKSFREGLNEADENKKDKSDTSEK